MFQSVPLYQDQKQYSAPSKAAVQLQPNHWHYQHHASLLFWSTSSSFFLQSPSFSLSPHVTHEISKRQWPPPYSTALTALALSQDWKQATLMWWAVLDFYLLHIWNEVYDYPIIMSPIDKRDWMLAHLICFLVFPQHICKHFILSHDHTNAFFVLKCT